MFISELKSKLLSGITDILIAIGSLLHQPALATPVEVPSSFCRVVTDYNLNWLRMLQQGATEAQIATWHLEVLDKQEEPVPDELLFIINKMLYLTMLNKNTEMHVANEGLMLECTSEINKLKTSVKSTTI